MIAASQSALAVLLKAPREQWREIALDQARARLGAESPETRALLASALRSVRYDWRFWARPEQTEPAGDWRVWLMLAGRGGGKTRAGAEWVRAKAQANPGCRIALVGRTKGDTRDVIVKGNSGIASISPPSEGVRYQQSNRLVEWRNGSRAWTYSADEPDLLRGPQHHFAWADEVGAWRKREAWDNLMMGMRLGDRPRVVATTTPRQTSDLVKDLALGPRGADGQRAKRADVALTRWSTSRNTALPVEFLRVMEEMYGGTRLGRQELEAEILDDVPGALWTLAGIDEHRVEACPELERIVVSVDPSHAADGGGDACGIVVIGMGGRERHVYVRADRSVNASPRDWGMRAVEAYHEFRADLIVFEDNESPGRPSVVRDVIKVVDPRGHIRWQPVHASRDKRTRADPVSALYEQGKVHHVSNPTKPDHLSLLEDEMTSWDPASRQSPNRLDALVHGVSYLLLQPQPTGAAPHGIRRGGGGGSPWGVS